jgi:hypothetical protein
MHSQTSGKFSSSGAHNDTRREGRSVTGSFYCIDYSTFIHASHVTKFSILILRRRQRSLEFWLLRPEDKALGAFPWIWDRVEAYRRSEEQTWSFYGALGSSVSCFSHAGSATPVQPFALIGQKRCLIVNSSSFADSISPLSHTEREPRVEAILEWLEQRTDNLNAPQKLQVCSSDRR